jgi:hypothetical protein
MSIADTVLLQLEASVQQGYELQMPKVDKVLENFGIVDWDNLGNKLDDKNNVVTTYQYRLEPFLSGKYEIPALTFQFHDVNDPNPARVASEPVKVEVFAAGERGLLVIEDIEGTVEMPKDPRVVASGIGGLRRGAAGGRRASGRRPGAIFRPAHERSTHACGPWLRKTVEGAIKEFYDRISGI